VSDWKRVAAAWIASSLPACSLDDFTATAHADPVPPHDAAARDGHAPSAPSDLRALEQSLRSLPGDAFRETPDAGSSQTLLGLRDPGPLRHPFEGPHAPRVAITAVNVRGDLTATAVRRGVEHEFRSLRYCWARALDETPTATADAGFRFVASPTGTVIGVHLTTPPPHGVSDLPYDCLRQAMQRAQFTSPLGGGTTLIEATIHLEPGR
jgi:hypothetical protein